MKKNISISISKKLLQNIKSNVEGKNTSAKLEKVVKLGYEILINKK